MLEGSATGADGSLALVDEDEVEGNAPYVSTPPETIVGAGVEGLEAVEDVEVDAGVAGLARWEDLVQPWQEQDAT